MESKEKVEDSQLSNALEQDDAKLSPTDLVALDKNIFSIIKSAKQSVPNVDNRQIEQWKKELSELYNTLYDTSKYSKIEENAFLLIFFKKLKDNDKHKENYESLSKIFIGAYAIRKAIEGIKVLHTELNGRLSEIKTKIVMLAPTFMQALAQSSQKNTTEQNALIQRLRLIDQAKITKCRELIENLREKQEDLMVLYNYSHKDRENLVEILGCGMTQFFFDPNIEINLKTFKEQLEKSRESLENIQEHIHENEKLKSIERANMEYLKKVIENNDKEIQLLEQELDNLKNNVTQNEAKKKEILDFYTDPNSVETKQKERQKLKDELNQQYTELLMKTNEENNKIIDEIKKIKEVAKHFHLIFIIDESGSMSGGPYDQVISSVKKVIEIRKALPLTKDKMSLIKFNSEAKIEILNKSVNDEFKFPDMRGGGTSFVKPLESLVEILRDINFDVEIPIVMLLSDGKGESTQTVLDFINSKILNDPVIGYKCSNSENMLFFTIGYGVEADKETLEEMAKAFNKGKSIASIGREKVQLYHHVTTEDQLLGAFTVYQKIFDFQKNIVDTKRHMLDQSMALATQAHSRNCNALDELYAREDEEIKREETKSKLVRDELEAINNVYNERIEKCNTLRQALLEANKANSKEKGNCENELINFENKILAGKTEYDHEKIKFDNAEKEYKKFIDECSKFNMKLIESFEKDESFENLIAKLNKEYGMEISEAEKNQFKNQLKNFLNANKDLIDDSIKLEDRSNKITNEYNEIIEMCDILDTLLDTFAEVSKNETVRSKIFAMFVYRYYDKDLNIKSKLERMSDTEKKDILWKILFGKQSNLRKQETKKEKKDKGVGCIIEEVEEKDKDDKKDNSSDDSSNNSSDDSSDNSSDNSSSSEDEDDDHNNLRKAFNRIFSLISVEEFFIRNEKEEDFCGRFIEIYVDKIDDEMNDIKLQQKEAKKKKNLKLQESLNTEMEKLYKEKSKLKEFKREKLKILGLIKEKIDSLKEDYYQARVVFDMVKIFKAIKDDCIPKIDALKSTQRQVNNRAIQN